MQIPRMHVDCQRRSRFFYGQMDQKADRKRQELQELDQAHPPHEKENAAGGESHLKRERRFAKKPGSD